MANKYLHNISDSEKTYLGTPISSGGFYQIPDNMLIKFQNDASVMADILLNTLRLSSDGVTDYSTVNIINLNFLRNEHYEVDAQGRQIVRAAAGQKGWTYLGENVLIETSNLNSLDSTDYLGNTVSGMSLKFYDVNNVELTTQQDLDTSCVKTELTVSPAYDYEILGGTLRQITRPSTKVKLWTVGGILQLGANYTKEMVRNVDLRFLSPDDHIDTDGRASKYMKKDIDGVPYQANQLKFILKHEAGIKHELLINIEYFRA